jgi:glycyl-radical enzyme activating protein
MVFAIERCSLHDGPGIRTTVFFKGCPLRCLWCHNPESQAAAPTLYSLHERCTACGACVDVCPRGCHRRGDAGGIRIDRTDCSACGACVEACPMEALEMKGVRMSVADVLSEVERDRAYYDTSDGGMTLSGGEPLAQWRFAEALLSGAHERGIHTCVETCGFGATEHLLRLAAHTDLFYYDIKETDPARHRDYTGVDPARIIENLEALDRQGAAVVLRCPIVPGMNDRPAHLTAVADLANRLPAVREIHPLAYHPMGAGKLRRIGAEDAMLTGGFTEDAQLERWAEELRAQTHTPVVIDQG